MLQNDLSVYCSKIFLHATYFTFTGFGSILPYFHPIHLLPLLIHRGLRDDRICREEFGAAAWDRYCERVKYRIFPKIY